MAENNTWYRDDKTGQFVFDVSVVVNAPVYICFADWANFESFPKLLHYLDGVHRTGDNSWHWEATIGGQHTAWDAVTTEFRPSEVISWESTNGLRNSGSVYFSKDDHGCRVSVHMMYDPPYGFIGGLVAAIRINDEFFQDLVEDLDLFKRNVESGRADDFRRAA